ESPRLLPAGTLAGRAFRPGSRRRRRRVHAARILRLPPAERRHAERELRRAIALNPRYVLARYWYASLCTSKGRYDESITEDERAVEMEPLSVFTNTHLAWMLLTARRPARAIEQLHKAIELDPHFALAHWLLGCADAFESQWEDALAEFNLAVDLSHRLSRMVVGLAV